MVTGGDVGLICGEKNSCGSRFCTENADVCTVKTQLDSKAELKTEWMYINTGMGVAELIFWWKSSGDGNNHAQNFRIQAFLWDLACPGGWGSERPWTSGLNPHSGHSDEAAGVRNPAQDETVTESLEDLGWTDVMQRGAATLDEDSDPAFNDSIRTYQLAINLELMRINVETLERRLAKGLISNEETLDSLRSHIDDTRVQVGKDPGIYNSGEESVWEVIDGL
jgi:hypothetical protein